MNSNIILPMELINKILIMRPTHPTAKILQKTMMEYNKIYGYEKDYITFHKYIKEGGYSNTELYDSDLWFLFHDCNIRLKYNRVNERRICSHCGLDLWGKSFYYHNPRSMFVNCESCFELNE